MSGTAHSLTHWLALYHSQDITPTKFREYLLYDPQLKRLPHNLRLDWAAVANDLQWLQANHNAAILTLQDPRYPARLKEIYNPPPILYVQGNAQLLATPQIAIVGSRNASVQGLQVAKDFAAELARYGLTITSGMALGIDGASHSGALQVTGNTIAVLGCGVDVIYPKQHCELAAKILQHGCLVSEFPIGAQAAAYNFPRRNRIISGLSLGVLIVEAAKKSGSLITAQYALEQGREIFAIPGSINSTRAKGCHELIRNGAKLVDCVTDVIEELALLLQPDFHGRKATVGTNSVTTGVLNHTQQLLLNYIDEEPKCTDMIVGQTGLATSAVQSILLELELKGLITSMPGGGYARLEQPT